MKGINFLTDDSGRRTAVVIDIQTYGEELEDFLDGLEAEARRNEPREDFNAAVDRIRVEKQNG
ncbi:hypothetical protein [Fibrella aquatica]|jgi:hypothetical protein|uniref:hypothetical protein n=1 Tax=Fibrella aquatica TaxID=3242487 RepID=UPI003521704B